ncbi:hypothetical protein ARUE_232p01760 (plasmid) [Arthrobacter sp. Rue61a]|nr:hypothetical protein ARUE_232p01760 [Arthrobacter sp. Rue61a]
MQPEEQNSDYESGIVTLGSEAWRIRTARITPKKPGAFTAIWQRSHNGSTMPFTDNDPTEGLLVFVEEAGRFGLFRFESAHLVALGILKTSRFPGKRGFRVYPSWCGGLNSQALRTQAAQAPAFRELQ